MMSFDSFYTKKGGDESLVTPFDFDEMPSQVPGNGELKDEAVRIDKRMDWWQTPTYTRAVELQRRAAEQAAKNDVKRSKRERDAALIADMADILGRMFAQRGSDGAWKVPQFGNRAGAANAAYNTALARKDAVFVDYAGRMAQAEMQDYLNKRRQQAEMQQYELAKQRAAQEEEQQRMNILLKQAELALKAKIAENEHARGMAKQEQELDVAKMKDRTSRYVQDQITKRAELSSTRNGGNRNGESITVPTDDGVETYSKAEHGVNYIQRAYYEVIKKAPALAVVNTDAMGNPTNPSRDQMLDAISKYQKQFDTYREVVEGEHPSINMGEIYKKPNPMGDSNPQSMGKKKKKPNPMQ